MAMKISATKDGDSQINKNSSGLFLGVVFVLLLIGILALSLWVSELSKATNDNSAKVESRLSILEEQLQLADSTSTESLSDINSQLQFLDKEIRKLWDLSNKRNKVNIEKLSKDVSKYASAIKEIAITQTNDQANIRSINEKYQKLITSVNELTKANRKNLVSQNQIAELNKSILLLEETVQAFDAYRRQNNEMLQEMQLKISSMENKTSP
jgi:mannose/fructose/N-acetylgalactosamine-specific phosphotransferase system component IIB